MRVTDACDIPCESFEALILVVVKDLELDEGLVNLLGLVKNLVVLLRDALGHIGVEVDIKNQDELWIEIVLFNSLPSPLVQQFEVLSVHRRLILVSHHFFLLLFNHF
jgi:hypothetical protein